MRWVLFWVFTVLFVIIVLVTIGAAFYGIGDIPEDEESTYRTVFLVEVGIAVLALFYSIFDLKRGRKSSDKRYRLELGEFADVRRLIGKTVTVSPSEKDGHSLGDKEVQILDDKGPYFVHNFPDSTYNVFVSVSLENTTYSGSFTVDTRHVEMNEEQE